MSNESCSPIISKYIKRQCKFYPEQKFEDATVRNTVNLHISSKMYYSSLAEIHLLGQQSASHVSSELLHFAIPSHVSSELLHSATASHVSSEPVEFVPANLIRGISLPSERALLISNIKNNSEEYNTKNLLRRITHITFTCICGTEAPTDLSLIHI